MSEADEVPTDLLALVDLLSQRHSLALIWLLRGGARRFATLVSSTGAAQPLVSQRLHALRDTGLVEIDEAGDYRLTPVGRRMQGVLDPLAGFARDQWSPLTPRQRRPRGAADRGRGEPS